VAVAGYMLAGLVILAIGDRGTPRDVGSDAVAILLVSALLGAFIGHRWFRAPAPAVSAT